jgi:hypothetical protein
MNDDIPIQMAVEDFLSESVLRALLKQSGHGYRIGTCYGHKGIGFLRKHISRYNKAARIVPFLVLADLDNVECAPLLVNDWLGIHKHNNLMLRVAVRQVESWILADRKAFGGFLSIPEVHITTAPDKLKDSKNTLIELARKSRRRDVREALVPKKGSTARIGPDYNGTLGQFVRERWSAERAMKYSESLKRAFEEIRAFKPSVIEEP